MFYIKNLPAWERLLRIGLGIALIIYSLMGVLDVKAWLLITVAAILILSGVIGFCPACALAGRRLAKRNSA